MSADWQRAWYRPDMPRAPARSFFLPLSREPERHIAPQQTTQFGDIVGVIIPKLTAEFSGKRRVIQRSRQTTPGRHKPRTLPPRLRKLLHRPQPAAKRERKERRVPVLHPRSH